MVNFLRSNSKLPLRITVSALLLWWLVKHVSLVYLWQTLQHTDKWLLLLSMFLGLCCVVISAQQWKVLLEGTGHKIGLWLLTGLYLIGITFNQFLPTGLGGDVIKIVLLNSRLRSDRQLSPHSNGQYSKMDSQLRISTAHVKLLPLKTGKHQRLTSPGTVSATSVILSRLTGFIGMVAVAMVVAGIRFSLFTLPTLILLLAIAGTFFGTTFLIVNSTSVRLMHQLTARFPRLKLNKVYEVHKAIAEYRYQPGLVLRAIGVGAAFWVCTIVNHYVLARAEGVDISPWYFFVLVPIVLTISMVPIAINGFGVREGAFVLFLATAHVAASQAVTLALLMDAQALILAVLGGILFLFRKKFLLAPAIPELQAEVVKETVGVVQP